MSYREWTQREEKHFEDLIRKGTTIENAEKALDRTKVSLIVKLEEWGISPEEAFINKKECCDSPKARRTEVEKEAINFMDMNLRDRDYKNVWSSILDFQKSLDEKSIEQNIANIRIKDHRHRYHHKHHHRLHHHINVQTRIGG